MASSAALTKKSPSPPQSQPSYYGSPLNQTPHTPPLTSMRRESKAIPIVAPPHPPSSSTMTSSTASLTKENLVDSAPTPIINKDVEALLFSFEGKPIHEKKQLLGDKLFPLVKVVPHLKNNSIHTDINHIILFILVNGYKTSS